MFASNAHYGHRSILRDYAGLDQSLPIPGLVQHGWNYDLGATLADIRLPLPDRFFTWAPRNLERCQRAGLEHVVGLGAPFLYMPAPQHLPKRRPRSLLALPIHGWEREQIQQNFAEYAESLAELRGDFDEITVSLYWYDHQFPENRAPFEALGMKVVTVGHRDNNPAFLFDMRRLLLEHECATSNRIQTAAFYAMALGCRFFLRGPPVGLDGRFDHSGQVFNAWQEREFPTLLWRNFQGDVEDEMAAEELGAVFKRTPEQLQELFFWQPSERDELTKLVRAYEWARNKDKGLRGLWRFGRGQLATQWAQRFGPSTGSKTIKKGVHT